MGALLFRFEKHVFRCLGIALPDEIKEGFLQILESQDMGVAFERKGNAFDLGYQEFKKSKENVFAEMKKMINSLFEQRVTEASDTIAKVITYYETLLEQQEKAHQQNLQERELEKTFITQKRQELEQVQKEIAALLTQVTA